MSFLPLDQIAFKDGVNLDAAGRLRVSSAQTLLGYTQEYNYHPLVWDHYVASGGTATHSISNNSTVLSTGASTSGARALRQTKVYHRYVPGKSQLIKMTGRIQAGGAANGTAIARMGYFDDDNGLFFYQNQYGMGVAERSDVSGVVTDTTFAQGAWNIDRMDGSGPSGVMLDPTKEQVYFIDLQWLGVGRVRFGLQMNGINYHVHEMVHANSKTSVYMRTANLPPRFEVFNEGGSGSNISLEAVCCSIDSEGGGLVDPNFYPFSYSAYTTTPMALDTVLRPVVARRLKSTFNGKVPRGHASLSAFSLIASTNDVYWEVRYNPTVTVAGTVVTTDVNSTYSMCEFDTYTGAANTVTGGVVMYNGFAKSGLGASADITEIDTNVASSLVLGRTYSGVRDQYVLCAKSLTGAATLAFCSNIREQY